MDYNEQISNLKLLHNLESFRNEFLIDLLSDVKQSSGENYKYYKKRRRCFVPKILIVILEKYPLTNFYISISRLIENTESQNLYHEIYIDFNLEEDHLFNLQDLKSFNNAKFLNFYKTDVEEILSANFNGLTITSTKEFLNRIKLNENIDFKIKFGRSKQELFII
ncbi:hypothetical protein [Flavobacterium marginilacus]|uniref:hypothetical protein n=1 Tax=Flavobacterium marginilacus TaxID=3003256 RepID=UPI00248EB696|nr:hypothetical protein [Flavobacterium marginilacus]